MSSKFYPAFLIFTIILNFSFARQKLTIEEAMQIAYEKHV